MEVREVRRGKTGVTKVRRGRNGDTEKGEERLSEKTGRRKSGRKI